MTARVNIDAEAWGDLRFATLARLMGFADLDHALIKVAKIWSWQTEHYTPDQPTYWVDAELVDGALGPGGAAAMVRARLAEEGPAGLRPRGTTGRIEWLYDTRRRAIRGGEATKRKHANGRQPTGQASGQAKTGAKATLNGGPLDLDLDLRKETLSPARACAIPPSTEPVAEHRSGQPVPHATQQGAATPDQVLRPAIGNVAELQRAPTPDRSAPATGSVTYPAPSSSWHDWQRWWAAMLEADRRLRTAGYDASGPPLPRSPAGEHERNLAMVARQLSESGFGRDEVDARMLHIVAVSEAEAVREQSRRWFIPSLIWRPDRAMRAADTSLAEARRKRERSGIERDPRTATAPRPADRGPKPVAVSAADRAAAAEELRRARSEMPSLFSAPARASPAPAPMHTNHDDDNETEENQDGTHE